MRLTAYVKSVMSCNLVQIHPFYVVVIVVGTFWSCTRLFLFVPLVFGIVFVDPVA